MVSLLVSLSSGEFTFVNLEDGLTAGSFSGVFLVGLPYLQLDFKGLFPWSCCVIYRNLKGYFLLENWVNGSFESVDSVTELDDFDINGGFDSNPFLDHLMKKLEAVRLLDFTLFEKWVMWFHLCVLSKGSLITMRKASFLLFFHDEQCGGVHLELVHIVRWVLLESAVKHHSIESSHQICAGTAKFTKECQMFDESPVCILTSDGVVYRSGWIVLQDAKEGSNPTVKSIEGALERTPKAGAIGCMVFDKMLHREVADFLVIFRGFNTDGLELSYGNRECWSLVMIESKIGFVCLIIESIVSTVHKVVADCKMRPNIGCIVFVWNGLDSQMVDGLQTKLLEALGVVWSSVFVIGRSCDSYQDGLGSIDYSRCEVMQLSWSAVEVESDGLDSGLTVFSNIIIVNEGLFKLIEISKEFVLFLFVISWFCRKGRYARLWMRVGCLITVLACLLWNAGELAGLCACSWPVINGLVRVLAWSIISWPGIVIKPDEGPEVCSFLEADDALDDGTCAHAST